MPSLPSLAVEINWFAGGYPLLVIVQLRDQFYQPAYGLWLMLQLFPLQMLVIQRWS